jgi:hypothetical protein
MVSGDDERGQSVLIGSILLFGFLVIAFSGYQAVVVPNQNSDVEFEHFQDVEEQFTSLHTNIVNAVESDTERAVRLDLGMRYPPRLIALNPPPVDGRLRTTASREVVIADSSGQEITSDVCGEDATSRSLVYSPGYNEFQNAQSITYENTFSARTYRDGAVYGEQRLVRDDNIDLLLLNGSVSETKGGTYSLNINGSHRYRKTGKVTDPTITLPTQFSAGVWNNQILEGQSGVTASPNGSNHVDLSFTGDYTISCAVAGLNSDPAFSPPSEVVSPTDREFSVKWLSDLSGERPGDTRDVTVKVTDSVGNPIERATVDFATEDSNIADFTGDNTAAETNQEGNATVTISFGSQGETEVLAAAGDAVAVEPVKVEAGPTIDTFTTQQLSGEGKTGISYNFEVSADSADLDAVKVELRKNGEEQRNRTYDVSGQKAKENNEKFEGLQSGESYTLELTVTDVDGNEASETREQTAG